MGRDGRVGMVELLKGGGSASTGGNTPSMSLQAAAWLQQRRKMSVGAASL
jgi:hypothetical protein